MRWCFDDQPNPYADQILDRIRGGDQAVVPILWLYEVVAVVSKAKRRGILPAAKAQSFLDHLRALDIVVDEVDYDIIFNEVLALATRHGLSGYDVSYLELAQRKMLPLATLDEELRLAAPAAGVLLVTASSDLEIARR